MRWTMDMVPDQDGRTAIVTGSNTGLGFETASGLAQAGARVVLACRGVAKADEARAEILRRHPGAHVETLTLDLGDLSAVRDAAAEAGERFPEIDLLINNAGVMMPPRSTTADGFELQFGTNHLGHFAFTGLVLERLLAVPGSRVVTVSSIAHQQGRMRWHDLQWTSTYRRMPAYAQSKLANLLFAFALARRLATAAAPTIALAAHPGVSGTELGRYLPGAGLPGVKQLMGVATALVTQPPSRGALPTLRAATDPAAVGSEYYGPDGLRQMRGAPVLVVPDAHALATEDQERLWAISEELTGVTYPID